MRKKTSSDNSNVSWKNLEDSFNEKRHPYSSFRSKTLQFLKNVPFVKVFVFVTYFMYKIRFLFFLFFFHFFFIMSIYFLLHVDYALAYENLVHWFKATTQDFEDYLYRRSVGVFERSHADNHVPRLSDLVTDEEYIRLQEEYELASIRNRIHRDPEIRLLLKKREDHVVSVANEIKRSFEFLSNEKLEKAKSLGLRVGIEKSYEVQFSEAMKRVASYYVHNVPSFSSMVEKTRESVFDAVGWYEFSPFFEKIAKYCTSKIENITPIFVENITPIFDKITSKSIELFEKISNHCTSKIEKTYVWRTLSAVSETMEKIFSYLDFKVENSPEVKKTFETVFRSMEKIASEYRSEIEKTYVWETLLEVSETMEKIFSYLDFSSEPHVPKLSNAQLIELYKLGLEQPTFLSEFYESMRSLIEVLTRIVGPWVFFLVSTVEVGFRIFFCFFIGAGFVHFILDYYYRTELFIKRFWPKQVKPFSDFVAHSQERVYRKFFHVYEAVATTLWRARRISFYSKKRSFFMRRWWRK